MPPRRRFAPPDLAAALDALLRQIPAGRVTTYGELARALGDVRLSAWIGERLLAHPHEGACPCHRVVRSNGAVGLWITGDPAEKTSRLIAEGVAIRGGTVELADVGMAAGEFRTSAPLKRLQELQSEIAAEVRDIAVPWEPRLLCGLDVAYPSSDVAVGAAVLVDAYSGEVVWRQSLRDAARFPYVPGYLAFRELPLLLALWEQAALRADSATVCFVDGNGRLHPRRAGVACCFGVLADVPTIGVSKSLLCGRPDETAPRIAGKVPIRQGDETLGVLLPGRRGGRPLYLSVGHRLSLTQCVQWTCQARTTHRLPEPLYLADRLSKSDRGRSFPSDDAARQSLPSANSATIE